MITIINKHFGFDYIFKLIEEMIKDEVSMFPHLIILVKKDLIASV